MIQTKEKILSIEEAVFDRKDGYIITTDAQEIRLGIDNEQSCCEEWGCIISEDDTTEFIGAYLLDVTVVDGDLNTLPIDPGMFIDDLCTMFVNIETTKGTLQFALYNYHNGYYGHTATVESKQLNYETSL